MQDGLKALADRRGKVIQQIKEMEKIGGPIQIYEALIGVEHKADEERRKTSLETVWRAIKETPSLTAKQKKEIYSAFEDYYNLILKLEILDTFLRVVTKNRKTRRRSPSS